jgi:hypothetical protein
MFRCSLRAGACLAAALACLPACPPLARAGVVNPDISVIGQPVGSWTDAAGSIARKRVTLDAGETEIVFDADLNPYARGTFTTSLGAAGLSLEEGFFTISRGLPAGLALKAGKYRAGFGKLNPAHPHTDPFGSRFHLLREYLPGEDGYNETGLDVSKLVALPGDGSLTLSADWLQGDSFRRPRNASDATNDPLAADPAAGDRTAEPRPAVLARAAGFFMLGERSGLELGLSGTQGTNNVAAGARTTVLGADAKAKLWRNANSYLLLQGEFMSLRRDEAGWDSTTASYTKSSVKPAGGYVFADYNFSPRYDTGVSYEHWQAADAARTSNQAIQLFAGLALMEETTSFRIGWEHAMPGRPDGATADPKAINTVTLRVIYSMGPHKAHQF